MIFTRIDKNEDRGGPSSHFELKLLDVESEHLGIPEGQARQRALCFLTCDGVPNFCAAIAFAWESRLRRVRQVPIWIWHRGLK